MRRWVNWWPGCGRACKWRDDGDDPFQGMAWRLRWRSLTLRASRVRRAAQILPPLCRLISIKVGVLRCANLAADIQGEVDHVPLWAIGCAGHPLRLWCCAGAVSPDPARRFPEPVPDRSPQRSERAQPPRLRWRHLLRRERPAPPEAPRAYPCSNRVRPVQVAAEYWLSPAADPNGTLCGLETVGQTAGSSSFAIAFNPAGAVRQTDLNLLNPRVRSAGPQPPVGQTLPAPLAAAGPRLRSDRAPAAGRSAPDDEPHRQRRVLQPRLWRRFPGWQRSAGRAYRSRSPFRPPRPPVRQSAWPEPWPPRPRPCRGGSARRRCWRRRLRCWRPG